jgi:hypothetical protein
MMKITMMHRSSCITTRGAPATRARRGIGEKARSGRHWQTGLRNQVAPMGLRPRRPQRAFCTGASSCQLSLRDNFGFSLPSSSHPLLPGPTHLVLRQKVEELSKLPLDRYASPTMLSSASPCAATYIGYCGNSLRDTSPRSWGDLQDGSTAIPKSGMIKDRPAMFRMLRSGGSRGRVGRGTSACRPRALVKMLENLAGCCSSPTPRVWRLEIGSRRDRASLGVRALEPCPRGRSEAISRSATGVSCHTPRWWQKGG